jgi:antitoxin VapB
MTEQEFAMNLQIRDPRAHELARRIAARRNISLTEAVIDALEAECQRVCAPTKLAERLAAIADDLAGLSTPGGRETARALAISRSLTWRNVCPMPAPRRWA